MSWLTVSLIAATILGAAAIFDKKLISQRGFRDPWTYTFWVGVLGGLAIVLIPFGFVPLPPGAIAVALTAGVLFIVALFFFFWALYRGEASGALVVIGGLAPVFTLLFADLFFPGRLAAGDLFGFSLLVFGGFILLAIEERELRFTIMALSLTSALLFGLVNTLRKVVFEVSPFITGFVWMSLGGSAFALLSLLHPSVRVRIKASIRERNVPGKTFYLANRALASLGTALVNFAISLGHPALVDATQGFKYVVIFFGAWILLRERFSGKILFWKIAATTLVVAGVGWLGAIGYARSLPPVQSERPIAWGVTFSAKFSRELGLDWQENFEAILRDLKPKKLRLIAYWDEIEKTPGELNFADLDFELERAREADARVALVIGMKVPRWPECHIPAWARPLQTEEREAALRTYLQNLVTRYLGHPAIQLWQIENEPFLAFGKCPERGKDFIARETALVKSLDPARPTLVTDGGEFGLWYKAARSGDIFGTTMYRKAYPRFIGPLFGVVEYPIAPGYFRWKERVIRWVNRDPEKRFIVSELQGEPWGPNVLLYELDPQEQIELFSPEYFRNTIEYAKAAGFDEYYLWGAEWWFWRGRILDDWRYWNIAKEVLNRS